MLPKGKKEILKTLENFTLMDDTFMSKVFEQDKDCASYVLSILLGKQLEVQEVRTQDEIFDLQGHDVRLDVRATDAENKIYNIEVQRDNRGANPKRARRNASMIDANFSNPGKYGERLPEVYIIFITEHDYWKKNKPLYPIKKSVHISENETINYDDGSHVLYANGAYNGNGEIGELMHDFRMSNPDEMHDSVLKKRANFLKRSEQGVNIMCQAMADLGRKIGEMMIEEEKIEIAKDMLSDNMPAEKVATYTRLSMKKILKLQKEILERA